MSVYGRDERKNVKKHGARVAIFHNFLRGKHIKKKKKIYGRIPFKKENKIFFLAG